MAQLGSGSFNTFTFWEGLRLITIRLPRRVIWCFNTFTFWEGLRLSEINGFERLDDGFQHLYLLGRSATSYQQSQSPFCTRFQHLYLLGRSATPADHYSINLDYFKVSTPLPSGKVCDFSRIRNAHLFVVICFNTFTFWEGLRLLGLCSVGGLPPVSTPLPSGKVCDYVCCGSGSPTIVGSFNTFTFWEGLRPHYFVLGGFTAYPFQHLYLLGRSATSVLSGFG